MTEVVLRCEADNGEELTATFLPEKGMNMISYRRGEIEVIDPETRSLFDERYAGLGALIGPHFHRRPVAILPKIENESAFPHIARVKENGVQEPFSHGIARYAPWQFEASENSLTGRLTGDDEWNGIKLKELEGQDFTIDFEAKLRPTGLQLTLSCRSDTDSLMGIHYYYRLPSENAKVEAYVAPNCLDQGKERLIPEQWNYDAKRKLSFSLNEEADFVFHPSRDPLGSEIVLSTEEYTLNTRYRCTNEENSWQLYHPKGASFVCIEPMSARNPRKPRLSVSGIEIELAIEKTRGATG